MLIKEKIKTLIALKKEMIIKLLFLAFGGFFLSLGWITVKRLAVFASVILIIYVYKILIGKANLLRPIKNIRVLHFLLAIDSIKMLHLRLVMWLYLLLFNLLEYGEGKGKYIEKLIRLIEWLLKILLINPILLISYKFYYFLNILLTKSLKEAIFEIIKKNKLIISLRVYCVIIAVLIFSPFLSYIYIMLGGVLWAVIYIIVVIINYKSLKISEGINWVFWYRRESSIFTILIRNSANIICSTRAYKSAINEYAFEVSYIYRDWGDAVSYGAYIIDYLSFIKQIKIIIASGYIESYVKVFKPYHQGLGPIPLSNIFLEMAYVKVCLLQIIEKAGGMYDLKSIKKLQIIKKYQKLSYLLVKLFLYFHWNSLKLISKTDDFLNDLMIVGAAVEFKNTFDILGNNRPYAYMWYNQYMEISKMIRSSDFITYRSYYEQVYVYMKLGKELVYNGKSNWEISDNEHTLHIKSYLEEFLVNSKEMGVIYSESDLDDCGLFYSDEMTPHDYSDEVTVYLIELKNKLIEEWKRDCSDVNQSNYYEKNSIPLNQLNSYVEKEINKYKQK